VESRRLFKSQLETFWNRAEVIDCYSNETILLSEGLYKYDKGSKEFKEIQTDEGNPRKEFDAQLRQLLKE
jgi:hypothetical protein